MGHNFVYAHIRSIPDPAGVLLHVSQYTFRIQLPAFAQTERNDRYEEKKSSQLSMESRIHDEHRDIFR